jgi:hypothetical protein
MQMSADRTAQNDAQNGRPFLICVYQRKSAANVLLFLRVSAVK